MRLEDRLLNELAMLVTLSFLIKVDAELRTKSSLRDRVAIPGSGSISRLQTSVSKHSSLTRSLRGGTSTGIRDLVVSKDRERLIGINTAVLLELSRIFAVFFKITWHIADLGPTVVARCMDICLAIVPVHHHQWVSDSRFIGRRDAVPGFPNTVPRLFIPISRQAHSRKLQDSGSAPGGGCNLARHSNSSLGVQAVRIISYSWQSYSKTSFQEKGAE